MYKSKLKPDDGNQQHQEFPIVCSGCLGDNPFMTMTKAEMNKQCKICSKPYNVYRWKPGTHARFKKTEICKTCATVKNVCQVCIHDLQFGLPVQIRDAALLSQFERAPTSELGVAYQSELNEKLVSNNQISFDGAQPTDIIQKLLKNNSNSSSNGNGNGNGEYKHNKNQVKVCTFYLKGNCNRGEFCPFRHSEEDQHDPNLKNQNIKDRYYGRNDPVANKMMNKLENKRLPKPPQDTTITTLYLLGITEKVLESDLRINFFPFGSITHLQINQNKASAFISYENRESAEKAIESLHSNLIINDSNITVLWSKSNYKENKFKSNNNNNTNSLVSYSEEDNEEEEEDMNTNNNNSNNNSNNTESNTDITNTENNEKSEEKENEEQVSVPVPVQVIEPPKPAGIKNFPTFKFNSNTKSNEFKVPPKPYYTSMDPSNYGSKLN